MSTPPAFSGPLPGNPPVPVTRLRQVVDGMHEGVVVRDASGTIVDLNPAAERILRRPRAELIGSKTVNPRTAVNSDGSPLPHHESAASVALATGRDVVEQLNGVTMDDGELRWISVNARALREGDVITGVVTTFIDVTEQRKMVAALAESERRFRLLAENAGDLITSIDARGIRTYVSPSCRILLGYEPDELIGRTAVDIVHPDDRDAHRPLPAVRARRGAGEQRGALPAQGRSLGLDGDARPRRARRAGRSRRAADRRPRRHRAPRGGRDAARQRGRCRRRARRAHGRAGRDHAVRDHRHRRRRPDHRLQRRRRAHARLRRRRRRRPPPSRALPRPGAARGARRRVGHRRSSPCSGTGRARATPTRATGRSCAATASSCPVSLAITAIRAADGTLTGYLGIGRDITAERQAARELRDAEERFRNAFDQAPIGKALVSPDGRFTRVNSALCSILGYGEAELLGDDVPDAHAPRRPRCRPRATCAACWRARASRTRWRSATSTPTATTSGPS